MLTNCEIGDLIVNYDASNGVPEGANGIVTNVTRNRVTVDFFEHGAITVDPRKTMGMYIVAIKADN